MKKFMVLFLCVCMLLSGCSSPPASSAAPTKTNYDTIDAAQIERIPTLKQLVDDSVTAAGITISSSDVKWIGYSNYKDVFTIEEFEDFADGGYFAYSASVSDDVMVTGWVRMFSDDGSDFEILSLDELTGSDKTPIVEYDESKLNECWETYYNMANPE